MHVQTGRLALTAALSVMAMSACGDQVASSLVEGAQADNALRVSSQLNSEAGRPVIAEVGQHVKFHSDDETTWTSVGGVVSPEGEFASSSTGSFQLVRQRGRKSLRDTVVVVVVPPAPTLESVIITPDTLTITAGDSVRFAARGRLPDGTLVDIGVTWTAEGGSIDAGGVFIAGMVPGADRVVVRSVSGILADTAIARVIGASAPPVIGASAPPVIGASALPVIVPIATDSAGAIDWSRPAGTLPTSAAALVALNIIGPTLTASASAAQGGMFATYESRWLEFAEYQWQHEGKSWTGNYYDRVLNYYALWIRTGDLKWRYRADSIAVDYRTVYLEANNYGASPHWSQLEGLMLHYWLNGGDVRDKQAIVGVAGVLAGGFYNPSPTSAYHEGRIQARAMMATLLACLLKDTTRDWCGLADGFVNYWIAEQQPSGEFVYRLNTEDPNSPMGQVNYMEGIRADALIKYYQWRKADPRIPIMVTRMADYMMTTQWNSATGTFRYQTTDPVSPLAADLNHLIVEMFGFAYQATHLEKYRALGDAAFDAGEPEWMPAYIALGAGEFLGSSKQYNEHYYTSFRYLAQRR